MTTLRERARKLCYTIAEVHYPERNAPAVEGGDCPSCDEIGRALVFEQVRQQREDCAAMCEWCAKGKPVHKCECGQCVGWIHDDVMETECVAAAIHERAKYIELIECIAPKEGGRDE